MYMICKRIVCRWQFLQEPGLIFCPELNAFKYVNINSFVCTHLNSFQYSKLFSSSIWPIVRNLTGATDQRQSGPGFNGNEVVLHIPQNSSNVLSLSNAV